MQSALYRAHIIRVADTFLLEINPSRSHVRPSGTFRDMALSHAQDLLGALGDLHKSLKPIWQNYEHLKQFVTHHSAPYMDTPTTSEDLPLAAITNAYQFSFSALHSSTLLLRITIFADLLRAQLVNDLPLKRRVLTWAFDFPQSTNLTPVESIDS